MPVPRLKEKYRSEIVPAMREKFGYKNVMQVPKVIKVTLNMGVGAGTQDAKQMEEAATQLGQITGQKAQVRRARKSGRTDSLVVVTGRCENDRQRARG